MNIDERIARVRAHVEKNDGKERATFSLDGIRALLEAIDARHAPAAAVQALLEVKDAILRADPDVLTDTLWMPDDVLKGATVVDRIDIALSEQTDAHAIKLDGPELWEIVFGVNSDAAGEISDDQYDRIAAHINTVFVDPTATAVALERAAIAVDKAWREEGGLNCTKVCAIIRSALSAQAQDASSDDEEEPYQIGVRDGYSQAVQEIDRLTGGDGEYRYCTDHDPERHTPGPSEMIQRIVDRFEILNLIGEAEKRGDFWDVPGSAQVLDAKEPEGFELFGHWSKHRLADGCFLPLPCYVPEGPDYTTVALYRAAPAKQEASE